ncbi:Nup93/Nic96-domain-containing protein [Lipomyces arxii]|uniref:Nup93/Nic96-domain-containing protein n=1 Tax=Lipomyces arxii TaxID=56418 RepID=UPI0034CE06FE
MATTATNPTTPAQPMLLPPAASLIDQLLESTKSLPCNVTGLGSIQLGINEISSQARILREKAPPSADGDTKAHYLLAASGINAENIAQDLETVTLRTFLEPVAVSASDPETDIALYLRYKREQNIVGSIENSVKQTINKFDAFVSANIKLDWNYEKLLVCEHYGLVPRGTANKLRQDLGIAVPENAIGTESVTSNGEGQAGISSASGASAGWKKASLGRSVLGPVSGSIEFSDAAADPSMNQQQSSLLLQTRKQRYATVVSRLNDFRLAHHPIDLIEQFSEVAKSLGVDTRTQQLYDSWKILHQVVSPDINERQFAQAYSESSNGSADNLAMRKKIARGSLRYLQFQFFTMVEAEIAKYPQEAKLGGVPSVVNKILAFLKLRFNKNGQWMKPNLQIVNNSPIWALLFLLFRSGHLDEALEYTIENEGFFQKIERSFPAYLKAYVKSGEDCRLPHDLAERLQSEFNHHIRAYNAQTDDPYKFALYKIMGRCDLSRRNFPEILTVTEDWVWVQLMLVDDSPSSGNASLGLMVNERFTLPDLQVYFSQLGARHFNAKGTNPLVYFQVLLLSGQYERAIHYLYKIQPVDAVHYAIGLAYYGLLRVVADTASSDVELLVLDEHGLPEIDFAKLVGYYTRDFRRTDPIVTVDYLCLICLCGDLRAAGKGQQYLNMCHEALRELVLETHDIPVLLGDVRSDGTREPGTIEKKMELINITNEQEYLQTITQQAAIQAEQDGRIPDAVLLYHLSEQYDIVVALMNKSLGASLSTVDLSSDSIGAGVSMSLAASEDPVQLARNVMSIYESNGEILRTVSSQNRDACMILLRIVDARSAFEASQWETCLEFIAKVNVLPLELNANTVSIRRRAQQFGGLDGSVAQNVPLLLVMTMESCVSITREMDASAYGDATRHQVRSR